MKISPLFVGLALFCLHATAFAQNNVPAVSTANITTTAPANTALSSNSQVLVSFNLPTVGNVKLAHVTFEDTGTNAVLYTKTFSVPPYAAVNMSTGGYTVNLKFYTATDLAGARLKLQLEDTQENLGPVYTVLNE